MKLYPFLILNHLTVPKTFVAMTFLSPLVGAADMSATTPAAVRGAGLGVGGAEGGGRLLGLGLAAHGCGDGDWGRRRGLRLLPGVMVTRRAAAVGLSGLSRIRSPLPIEPKLLVPGLYYI